MLGSIWGLTVAGISDSTVASVLKHVRKDEFTEKVVIGCGRECLVEARVELHAAISIKQVGASPCLNRDGVYPYRRRCGRRYVVVKLNGHSGLSVCAEKLLRAEATPRSGCCRLDVEFVGGADGFHLLKNIFLVDE